MRTTDIFGAVNKSCMPPVHVGERERGCLTEQSLRHQTERRGTFKRNLSFYKYCQRG